MKRSIRAYVFETNSSMTHALAYVEGNIFEQWKSGDLLICLHGISLDVETEDAWAEIPCIGWDDVEELTEEEIEQEYGIHPHQPYYSHEGRFPYAMFDDEAIKEEWINEGGVFTAEIREYDNWAEIDALYMG